MADVLLFGLTLFLMSLIFIGLLNIALDLRIIKIKLELMSARIEQEHHSK